MEDISRGDLPRIIEKISRYCAFRERCIREVLQKLQEMKVPAEKRSRIISYLEENNFISEARFAGLFARGKFHVNKWGRIKIQSELKNRGIPDDLIRNAMTEIGGEEYLETIRDLILKKQQEIKAGKNLNIREKIITFVTGKGFEFDITARILKELNI